MRRIGKAAQHHLLQRPAPDPLPGMLLSYFIFFVTGVAVMTPGTLLPLLTARWHMGDGSAGVLFLCSSVSSSCGALLACGKLSRSLAAGCALTAAGAALLVTSALPQFSIALYGCGLGLCMTSISLLRSRLQTAERIREFARLNLTWALGASFAPAILLRVAARSGVAVVLDGLAILFASFVLFTVVCISSTMPPRTGTQARWFRGVGAVPMIVLLLIPLTTGTESGIGNWLSLYILRSSHVLSITIRTTTAFGFGILMSRLVYSRNTHPERLQNLVLRLHPALIVVGLVLLITVQSAAVSTGAALLTGFGVGPLYPLALAILLNHDEAGNLGFVAGGFGASVLPLITGAVSSWTHSLRTGLLVLLVSALLMAVLASRVPVGSPTSPREQ